MEQLKKRLLTGVAIFVGVLIMGVLIASGIWPVINRVETGKTPEYAEIIPHYFTAEPGRVFEECKGSVEAIDGFTVAASDLPTRKLKAAVVATPFGFEHDMTITIEPVTEFVTRVHVLSASRSGKGDFGQNARNIETFFTELDRRLGAVRFEPTQPKDGNKSAPPP